MTKVLLVIGVLTFGMSACGQEKPSQNIAGNPAPVKTKLEAFQAKTGAVIVMGFSEIGKLSGIYGGSVIVESKEFTDAGSGNKEYGITIEVKKAGDLERENTSYVDYDEIESLIQGMDYIAKVKQTVTKLDHFQAEYRTKGDFAVSTFSGQNGSVMAAVSSGSIGRVSAYFPLSKLEEIKGVIVKAKSTLDGIKSAGQ